MPSTGVSSAGSGDGIRDGSGDGAEEAPPVGRKEGAELGAKDGWVENASDGPADGLLLTDGVVDGMSVKSREEGAELGAKASFRDGFSAGHSPLSMQASSFPTSDVRNGGTPQEPNHLSSQS